MRLAPVLLILLLVCAAPTARADDFSDLAWRPHPGAQLPLGAALADETGHAVTLGTYFSGQPVVLVLEYLRCRTLCGVTLQNVVGALHKTGRDYELVAVSIDPRDGPEEAAAAKQKYDPGDGRSVHFLTGSEPALQTIAEAVGMPFHYDPEVDQYIHPAGFIVAAPYGRISRYFFGVGAAPSELNAALGDAKQGKALDPLTRLLLLCHVEGLPIGRYSLPIEAAFLVANLAGLTGLIAIFAMIRRRRG